jgi:hypothetical protein
MTVNRSPIPGVRNPLLRLPATRTLLAFLQEQPEVQQRLATLLYELVQQADQQAEHSWTQRKAPMAGRRRLYASSCACFFSSLFAHTGGSPWQLAA